MTQSTHRRTVTKRDATTEPAYELSQQNRSAPIPKSFDRLDATMDSLGFSMVRSQHASLMFGLD